MPAATVVVERARPDTGDVLAITAIDAACFPAPTVDAPVELERPWAHLWVARPHDAERAVGFLLAWLVADELHVLNVATAPAFRRRGIGAALVGAAVDFARDRRLRLILLEVRRSNRTAIRLYRAAGFSAMGIRPSYYADNQEDAIDMALALDPVTGQPQARPDEVDLEDDLT